jgi:ATP-dependent RNA helicase RhlE
VEELTHVINYELPNVPETYVHRIGRTGRAGAEGSAWSFCDAEEKAYLKDIQKLIAKTIPVVNDHPWPLAADAKPPVKSQTRPKVEWTRKTVQKKPYASSGNNRPKSDSLRSRMFRD